MGGSTEHIVMLPLMAHGHLIPLLALAREIHQRKGFTITIASTPLNIKYLRSTICKDSSSTTDRQSAIHLAELPFCCSGLPPNSDNTENLHVDQIGTLLRSTISLETPFHRLLLDIIERDGKPPMCVISDFFMGWAVDVAKAVGTSSVTFTPLGAYGTLAYWSSWLNVPHGIIDSEEFHLPGFPDTCRFPVSILTPNLRMADGNDSWSRIIQPQILSAFQSSGYLCHTVEELEHLALEWLRKYTNLPVWPVGPLLPQTVLNNSSSSELTRGAQSTIEGGKVEKVIQMVMDKEGKGGEMKRKAVETGKKIRAAKRQEGEEKGSSIKALDDFVAAIIAMRKEQCVGSMRNE
ncbi:hypothetical protein QQP08_017501 [Theobroma cacao]|nr:hypothetical protein QQP08_017501 [Theobroma cacao]